MSEIREKFWDWIDELIETKFELKDLKRLRRIIDKYDAANLGVDYELFQIIQKIIKSDVSIENFVKNSDFTHWQNAQAAFNKFLTKKFNRYLQTRALKAFLVRLVLKDLEDRTLSSLIKHLANIDDIFNRYHGDASPKDIEGLVDLSVVAEMYGLER